VAKRVRSETAIGRNAVGFGHAALHQARAIFGNLKGRSALLVGTGKMAGSTARLLAADGIARLYFSTRTAERAMELASSMPHGVMTMTVPFSHLDEVGGEVDLIISSSSSPEHLFTRSIVEGYMRRRRRRPLFMLDLALPRDIAPDVAEVEDAYVYNIDDLAREVERGLSERGKAMPAAEAIVRQELERTTEAMQQRQAGPAIAALIEEAEALRRREVERNLPPGLTPAQRNDIEQLTRSLTQKMLHPAISYLRQNPHDQDAALLLRRLFAQTEGSS
jgi:glutamyl-tRNA reductase